MQNFDIVDCLQANAAKQDAQFKNGGNSLSRMENQIKSFS